MRGNKLKPDWRTVQLFISSQAAGVFEVEIDTNSQDTRCSCPVWKKTLVCKHVRFVETRMISNSGHYSIQIPYDIPPEMAIDASEDAQTFREFVLKYAKIEVL